MYSISIKPELDEKLVDIKKRYAKHFEIIMKKAEEIVRNPYHYKPLRSPMQHMRRVHIDKHFVLIFSIDEKAKTVVLENFDHHDNIYKR
ncbi:MAG: type II toxin-antitoxin system RelE/ParE family toxin [Candidatus Aenigmatarchaeota archaeon]